MAPGSRARRRLLAWLAASAVATGVVSCALLGDIGDLPYPPADAATREDVTGPPADAADVTTGDHVPEGASDVTTQDSGCTANLTSCGASCVNTGQDPANCGRCGHGCQGGACDAGACEPFALTDGGLFGTPFGIAVLGNRVYWVNNGLDGTILAVAVDGGPFASVVPYLDAGQAVDLAVNDTTVYFTVGGAVMSSPLGGGVVATITTGLGSASGIALNGTSMCFTDFSNPGNVYVAPLDGGTVAILAAMQSNPGAVAVNDTTAYWTASGSGYVFMATLDGGPATQLASAQSPYGIALDPSSAYWTTRTGLYSLPLDGGSGMPKTLASSQNNASGVAVDGSGVYWVNYGDPNKSDGTVQMVPLDGGAGVTLATSQTNPQFIAIDSTSVYWTNDAFSGNVMKVAKP